MVMIIQSKKVWIAGQFIPAQLEVAEGKITAVREYGERSVDQDYGTKRIVPGFIDVHTMELMDMIPMTESRRAYETG